MLGGLAVDRALSIQGSMGWTSRLFHRLLHRPLNRSVGLDVSYRALDIAEFVDLKEIDPVFFEKAYFLGPAPGGGKTYNLLSTAMKKQNKVGVARWVSSGKEHLVVLRPFEKGLILHTMYYADEVRDFGAIDIEHGAIRDKEVQLAEMLIERRQVPAACAGVRGIWRPACKFGSGRVEGPGPRAR